MKKLICITAIMLGITAMGFTQSKNTYGSSTYQSAIGLRIGSGYYDLFSASFKTFVASTPGAIELNLGIKPDNYYYDTYYGNRDEISVSFAASYQYHFKIPVDGLQWFIGGGLIVSSTSHYGFGMGVFPTGGVDYKFAAIPLNLTADVRPIIGFIRPSDYYNYFYPSVGISARYTFK